ncbi:MAG: shikimate dehydrogenase [Candidatus Omnitrophica bacterium]|nr:shikimate dehydrogenase [Candidatus Omnitrophota bacterium]MCM8793637.1 shikimate dehydrogenase [Candidatus Omnitrophota bacterium]
MDAHTKIYGIIGYPVRHSFSPVMHNSAFQSAKINAVYLAFEVLPENLKDALVGMKAIGIQGFNVTIPHKETCIPFLDEVYPTAKIIGAVNTVVLKEGKFIGYNTDGKGFIRALETELKIKPRGKRFFILGAGGAARAVGFNLLQEGARELALYDIVRSKAESLVIDLRLHFPNAQIELFTNLPNSPLKGFNCLINATPLGMKKEDALVIDPKVFHPKLIVCDLIYNPPQTKLLKIAQSKRLRTMNGLGMLLYQGVLSWEIWTGKKAPVSIMRKELEKAIAKK